MPRGHDILPRPSGLCLAFILALLGAAPALAQQAQTAAQGGNSGNAADANAAAPAMPTVASPNILPRSLADQQASNGGMVIPPPPAPSQLNSATISSDANQLAAQAEQAALQAQADQEAAQQKIQEEHIERSFTRAETGVLPLAPEQIRAFMHRLEETQQAAEPPYAGPPKGQVRITTISLDPGAAPPEINLAAGYVTTINILDATGEPWPILDVGVGGNFEVSPTSAGSHVVRVMPLTRIGHGDLSVLLKDLPTPVIFRLAAGGADVDLRYDARVPKVGPNGKAPLVDHPRIEAGNDQIMMLLENAPPSEAKRMKVSGLDARTMAWMMGDHVYVRTPLTLLSPAWNASVSAADGTTVYEIGDAPVLLMSDNGAIMRAHLSRDEDK